ncbi:MAG: hypothetical protein GX264_05410 [Clostridiales bacterium]|jgi:ATP phosphoribosyltransferase regulatory subunit HisZ|nr:hypothetical protein [Clostridiales bacterium]
MRGDNANITNLLAVLSDEERTVLKLRALFEQRGYRRYHTNRFEEYRFYLENLSFLRSEQVITFSDLDGRLMALKPDVTLSIAKNVDSSNGLRKLYYIENVYRPNATGRSFAEINQMGLECIGPVGRKEVREVIHLAYESLKLTGEPFRLSISHVGFIAGLLKSLRVPPKHYAALFESIASKNPHGLLAAAEAAGIGSENIDYLKKAALLSGEAQSVLKQAELLCRNGEMQRSLNQIRHALEGLTDPNILVDFSIRGDEDYYSGIMFCGYIEGKSRLVLSGGQYDNMMKKLHKSGRAIGFALTLNELFGR